MLPTLSAIARARDGAAAPVISSYFLVKCDAQHLLDQTFYLALGQHEMYLVDHDLGSAEQGVTVLAWPYTSLEWLSLDPDDFELLRLDLARPPRTVKARSGEQAFEYSPRLTVRCVERRRVVDEVTVALKTDHMFQTWEVHVDDVERADKVLWGKRATLGRNPADAFAVTSRAEARESLQSYFFFRPSEYLPSTRDHRGSHKVQFDLVPSPDKDTPDAASLQVLVVEPAGEKQVSVQALCERTLRDVCASVQDWRMTQRASPYVKRMNLTGDPAAWTCFQVRARTFRGLPGSRRLEYRDVCVIAARRAFIPPTMLDKRDFVVVHTSARKDFSQLGQGVAERLVDSLSPEAMGFDKDELVVQAVADALLLDAPAYDWHATSLHVFPGCHDAARAFCASLVAIMVRAGGMDPGAEAAVQALDDAHSKAAGPGAIAAAVAPASAVPKPRGASGLPTEGPMQLAARIETDLAPGLDVATAHEQDWAAWRVRVWKYLAYCVDGGVYPGVLSVQEVARQWKVTPDKKVKLQLQEVLEALLHLRPRGGKYAGDVPFAAKATDEALMRSCAFNDAMLVRLLEAGFVQAALQDAGDGTAYPRFLVRILRMGDGPLDGEEDAEKLRYAVVKRLVEQSSHSLTAESSSEETVDDVALNHLVPNLVNLLINFPQDDKLRVLAVATLVNFSHNNKSVKASILAGGTARVLVGLLKSHNDDLVRHTCSLLTNLTKSPEFRASVARGMAVPALLALLERKTYPPRYRSHAIVSQAASVLGNLAIDPGLRRLILDTRAPGAGDAAASSASAAPGGEDAAGGAIPGAIRALACFFTAAPQELGKDMLIAAKERELMLASVAFALKNLVVAAPGQAVNAKRALGRLALRGIIDTARDAKDSRLVDVVLRLLYVLCFDAKVCQKLMNEHAGDVLDKHKTEFPELVLQINAKIAATRAQDVEAFSAVGAAGEGGEDAVAGEDARATGAKSRGGLAIGGGLKSALRIKA